MRNYDIKKPQNKYVKNHRHEYIWSYDNIVECAVCGKEKRVKPAMVEVVKSRDFSNPNCKHDYEWVHDKIVKCIFCGKKKIAGGLPLRKIKSKLAL